MPKGKPKTIAEKIADNVYDMLVEHAKEMRELVHSQVQVMLAKQLGLPHGEEVMGDYVTSLIADARRGKGSKKRRRKKRPARAETPTPMESDDNVVEVTEEEPTEDPNLYAEVPEEDEPQVTHFDHESHRESRPA